MTVGKNRHVQSVEQFLGVDNMGTQANYALRLPLSLKSGAEQVAREDGSTLNQKWPRKFEQIFKWKLWA